MAAERIDPTGGRGAGVERDPDSLPDSADPNGPCPRCDRVSTFEHIGSYPISAGGGYTVGPGGAYEPVVTQRVSALACRGCGQGVAVVEDRYIGGHRAVDEDDERRGGQISWRGFHWWPVGAPVGAETTIPESVREAFDEASRCLAVKAPRAAAVMFRRTIEAMVDDLGSEQARSKSTLYQRLAQMTEEGELDKNLAEWAKEIRLGGNVGGHYDVIDDVSQGEAEELSRLCRALMEYLYVMPAKVRRARSK